MVESSRLIVVIALIAGVGTTLLLSNLAWFRRTSVAARVMPFTTSFARRPSQSTVVTDFVTPVLDRFDKVFGITTPLAQRLSRAGLSVTEEEFRLRQFTKASLTAAAALMLTSALQTSLPVALLVVLGAPVLVLLFAEHQIQQRIAKHQQRLQIELPIVTEQLAMLINAGNSINSALLHVAKRTTTICAADLDLVCEHIRIGVPLHDALHTWAERTDNSDVYRLAKILSSASESGDLARLITTEAQLIRREAHRTLIESIDRRSQQVWIPITVATLVPGVIFLAIPFLRALDAFSSL